MEEDKNITIITKIPIETIVNKTVNMQPTSECEFNNLLIYNFTDSLLNNLLGDQSGGKKSKSKTKSKSNKKNKKKQTRRHLRKITRQLGGADPRLIVFFMSLFIVFVKGVQNMTDSDIVRRLKQTNEVSDLFRNYYGTCALNTLLFLKTIDLPTFQDLSIDMMSNKPGLSMSKMSSYLNQELNIHSRWASFSGRQGDNMQELIENYVEKIRSKLIAMRAIYSFSPKQSIITAMNYPKKQKSAGHSVVIWLMSNNEIVIIDPQKFLKEDIILYTSETGYDKFMFNDKEIKRSPIKLYIRDNIDITNENRDTDIFESMHIELDDIYGTNELSPRNKKIYEVISMIRETEDKITGLERIEEL